LDHAPTVNRDSQCMMPRKGVVFAERSERSIFLR